MIVPLSLDLVLLHIGFTVLFQVAHTLTISAKCFSPNSSRSSRVGSGEPTGTGDYL